jgi:hypothetical protein
MAGSLPVVPSLLTKALVEIVRNESARSRSCNMMKKTAGGEASRIEGYGDVYIFFGP